MRIICQGQTPSSQCSSITRNQPNYSFSYIKSLKRFRQERQKNHCQACITGTASDGKFSPVKQTKKIQSQTPPKLEPDDLEERLLAISNQIQEIMISTNKKTGQFIRTYDFWKSSQKTAEKHCLCMLSLTWIYQALEDKSILELRIKAETSPCFEPTTEELFLLDEEMFKKKRKSSSKSMKNCYNLLLK